MAAKNPKNPLVTGCYFIVGETPATEVFVSEELSEEQIMIADVVKEFCLKEIQEVWQKRGRELEVTKPEDKAEVLSLLKKAGELGLCGITVPEQYGGMDIDFKTNVLFTMNMAHGFSFATTLGAQTSIGVLPIAYYGTAAQKEKYLPGIASGELIAAYALTEPGAGSDANAGSTNAVLSADGKNYLMTGQKIWITNGGFADVFVVFAKIDKDDKLSAFIVERNFEGFTVGPEEKKLGIKGSSTTQLYFDNCKVPVENLLGERGKGFKMALNILNGGRLKAGAGGIGGTQIALTRAVEYANERKQFGKSIAEFGAIQYKIGDIAMKAFANSTAVFRTAHLIDLKIAELKAAGKSENDAKMKASAEFAVEASIIKVQGSDLACYAVDESLQIFGGMGYAVETGIEMGYRDARILKIYEGTNEINRMLAVGELTKRGIITKEIDLLGAGKKIPSYMVKQLLNLDSSSGKYAREERIVKGLKNCFLLVSGIAGKKMGKKLIDEQEIILNFYEVLAEAFITESVLLKIQKLEGLKGVDKEKLKVQQSAMQLYFYEAIQKARNAAFEAIDSFAAGSQRSLLRRGVKLMLKTYEVNPKELRREIAQYVITQGKYNL